MNSWTVRRVTAADTARMRALRLEMLADSPLAFLETLAQAAARSHEGYRQRITYQPRGRYWAFQAYETAIFLALALALAGFCFWRLNRRRS